MSEELQEILKRMKDFNYYGWLTKKETSILNNYIEQLQQENEHNKYILTECEKWLEEEKKKENWKYGDMYFNEFANIVLDKLQELKNKKID